MKRLWILLGLAALLCAGCAEDKECVPGAKKSCPCVGGASGIQTCAADGKSWGDCVSCSSGNISSGVELSVSKAVAAFSRGIVWVIYFDGLILEMSSIASSSLLSLSQRDDNSAAM